MTVTEQFLALDGQRVYREKLTTLAQDAVTSENTLIAEKIEAVLAANDDELFDITLSDGTKAMLVNGLSGAGDNNQDPAWFPKYKQFKDKPKEAIKHLLKVKKGDALKALYRKDIGYIDIVWGENDPKTNKGFGLKHIVEKHGDEIKQLGFKVEDFIPITVLFGNYKVSDRRKNRVELKGEAFKIVIEKDAKKRKNFVLTAFDLRPERFKRGLNGVVNEEKLRKHNKIVNGAGFTMPPLYGKTLISNDKDTKKSNSSKNADEIELSADMLYGLSMASPEDFGEPGLGKSVSVDDIYDMITKKMVAQIKKATGKGYVKKWKAKAYGKGFLTPINFVSKKPYRGINNLMLKNFDPTLLFKNPYFLTFKQIDKLGGKLKKGSKGKEVIYFTQLYIIEYRKKGETKEFGTYSLPKFLNFIKKNRKNLVTQIPESWTAKQIARHNSLPILKYYNVFNGEDVEGVDFKLNSDIPGKINGSPLPPKEEIEVAELIIKHYPRPKPSIIHKGDRAFYSYPANRVTVPLQASFETSQDYYRTLFHELTHCSGDPQHLNRDMGGRFGSKKYAKEELIAEWGATYLSAEAGIMWFTNKNHAEYLKNWNRVLTIAEDDNRFIMRAASAAQKAADYVLARGNEGEPAYLKDIAKAVKPRKQTVKKEEKKKSGKQMALFGLAATAQNKDTIAFNKEILEAKRSGIDPGKTFNLGKAKNPLRDYVGKGDITISGKTIKKSMSCRDEAHCIDWSYFINLPDRVNEPFAIFKSETVKGGLVILIRLKNHLNKPLLVALKLDQENKTKDIRSIYSKRTKKVYQDWYENGLLLYGDKKSDFFRSTVAPIATQSKKSLSKDKDTKTKPKTTNKPKNKGLKSPETEIIKQKALETVTEIAKDKINRSKSLKVRNIAANTTGDSEFYTVPGEVGRFFQAVERKPQHSVVITLDGHQGAGKTTFLYKVMNAFAAGHNRGVFFSLEEHPDSSLAKEKANAYIAPQNQNYVDVVGDLDNKAELYQIIADYDVVYIDSWQKLQRMVGIIRLDEDLRKKFDSKVFIVIFQQTTTGRTKGGAEVVFDGDIITKLVKEDRFTDNYAYFDKNRYTRVPLETLRFNIAEGYVYDPEKGNKQEESTQELSIEAVPID